jgi:hypothetical protein
VIRRVTELGIGNSNAYFHARIAFEEFYFDFLSSLVLSFKCSRSSMFWLPRLQLKHEVHDRTFIRNILTLTVTK